MNYRGHMWIIILLGLEKLFHLDLMGIDRSVVDLNGLSRLAQFR